MVATGARTREPRSVLLQADPLISLRCPQTRQPTQQIRGKSAHQPIAPLTCLKGTLTSMRTAPLVTIDGADIDTASTHQNLGLYADPVPLASDISLVPQGMRPLVNPSGSSRGN
jgi:hypothetical protein